MQGLAHLVFAGRKHSPNVEGIVFFFLEKLCVALRARRARYPQDPCVPVRMRLAISVLCRC